MFSFGISCFNDMHKNRVAVLLKWILMVRQFHNRIHPTQHSKKSQHLVAKTYFQGTKLDQDHPIAKHRLRDKGMDKRGH